MKEEEIIKIAESLNLDLFHIIFTEEEIDDNEIEKSEQK